MKADRKREGVRNMRTVRRRKIRSLKREISFRDTQDALPLLQTLLTGICRVYYRLLNPNSLGLRMIGSSMTDNLNIFST